MIFDIPYYNFRGSVTKQHQMLRKAEVTLHGIFESLIFVVPKTAYHCGAVSDTSFVLRFLSSSTFLKAPHLV